MAQFKRIWLPYHQKDDLKNSNGMVYATRYPIDDEKTEKANNKIQNLITQGWRIVSTAPVTASFNLINPKGDDMYHTFTSGIEVFLVKE